LVYRLRPDSWQGTFGLPFTVIQRLRFFCLAIIKGPPNDIYLIIEGPYDGYFTEKVSQAPYKISKFFLYLNCSIISAIFKVTFLSICGIYLPLSIALANATNS